MTSKKFEVQWEDDDGGFEEELSQGDHGSEREFLDLLKGTAGGPLFEAPKVGDKVDAVICLMAPNSDDVLLEIGGKVSAVMAKQDLIEANGGELKSKLGDKITAFVSSAGAGEVVLSFSLAGGAAKKQALENAHATGIPVRGRVAAVNKGGFDVTVMGRKAFCPVSQIDIRYVADPETFVGKEFDFLVQKCSGRDVVVSRAALLRQKAVETLAGLHTKMLEGEILEGPVVEVKEFGALVDLGGVTGMVHVSELGFGHVQSAAQAVTVGQKVKVKILKIEEQGEKLPRIALSMKALQEDPWEAATDEFRVGESYQGRVVRLTDFGAFVELKPGLDGLIHLSEMAWGKRIHHAKDVVKVDDVVQVRLLDVDPVKRRMSLSLKNLADDPWHDAEVRFKTGTEFKGKVESLKTFGAFVELAEGVKGLVPMAVLKAAFGEGYRKKAAPPAELEVKVLSFEPEQRKISLGLIGFEDDED